MVQNVQSVSSATPPAPAPQPAPDPVAAAPVAPAPAERSGPEPLELSVEKGESGVFVYSLKDPSTGRLVAVIPAEHAVSIAAPGDYSAGGYVSLTA